MDRLTLTTDELEFEPSGDSRSTISSRISSQPSTAPSKTKKKRKKKKGDRKQDDRPVESIYVEYEEDVDPILGVAAAGGEGFLEKLEILKELIHLTRAKKETKGKKKGHPSKMEKPAPGGKAQEADAEADELEEQNYVEKPATEKNKQKDERSQRNNLIKELQDEIDMETFNTKRRIRLEWEQMRHRRRQLVKTLHLVEERKKAFMDYALKCLEEEDWLRYLSCDGLPDPAVLPELNTFLFLWSLEDAEASMKTLPRQCEIVTYLIRKMDEIVDFSLQVVPTYLQNCKQIRQKFRDKLQNWVDMASYCLLRQIEKETVRVDLKNSKFVQELTPLVCCFWVLIRLPISIKQVAEKDKKAVEVAFEEVGLTIRMPLDLDCYCTAVRVLWLGYDHYSDLTASFRMPGLPEDYRMDMDLLTFCKNEHNRLTDIREEQREGRAKRIEEKRAMIERIVNPPVNAAETEKKKGKGKKAKAAKAEAEPLPAMATLPQLASPEEMVLGREDEIRKETRRLLFTRCKKTEINLRKYAILGGLYRIDLINQPPQPKDMRRDIFLTTLQLPKELEFVKFSRPYKAPPPAPDSERTPEVIEAEMKALEAAMEALVLVTLKLPDSVMWFEPPLVAHWLPDERAWSTEDVHDIKYNEEKQTITFRTGRLGIHGLAGYRFVNLPFQSWELKPEAGKNSGGGVVLGITGSIIQLEFLIRDELVCLHSIVGGGSTALQALIDDFMKPHTLILKMRAAGCDVFPEADAASYLKGLSLKHPVAVKHLQACMGLLSTAYIFSWSRWNATRGHREIVMQLKEVHGCIAKERSNSILLVTPFQAMIVSCSEVSPEFSAEPADPNDKFFSDVYHYALHNAGIKSRLAMQNISYKLSTTVTQVLESTNIINMSA